jgi:tetratricopeptide (TPR) repeat protein
VHIDPLNPTIWTSLGILFSRLHQLHDAVDAHGRALRIDPSQYYEWGNIGSIYDLKGQLKDAVEAYEIGLSLTKSLNPNPMTSSSSLPSAQGVMEASNTVIKNSFSKNSEAHVEQFRKRIGEIKAEMMLAPRP